MYRVTHKLGVNQNCYRLSGIPLYYFIYRLSSSWSFTEYNVLKSRFIVSFLKHLKYCELGLLWTLSHSRPIKFQTKQRNPEKINFTGVRWYFSLTKDYILKYCCNFFYFFNGIQNYFTIGISLNSYKEFMRFKSKLASSISFNTWKTKNYNFFYAIKVIY